MPSLERALSAFSIGGPGFAPEGRDLESEDTLRQLLVVSQLSTEVLDSISTRAVKDQLRSHVDRALALGVFGVPRFVIGRELFWWQDRIAHIVCSQCSVSPLQLIRLLLDGLVLSDDRSAPDRSRSPRRRRATPEGSEYHPPCPPGDPCPTTAP